MNILGGVFPQTEGKIFIDGKEAHIRSPRDAEKYGIGFIHQEPHTFGEMTVAENISISRLHKKVDYKQINEIAHKYLAEMDCKIDPAQARQGSAHRGAPDGRDRPRPLLGRQDPAL